MLSKKPEKKKLQGKETAKEGQVGAKLWKTLYHQHVSTINSTNYMRGKCIKRTLATCIMIWHPWLGSLRITAQL